MNQSNTRLSATEKETLVEMKKEFANEGGEVFYFPYSGLTVAMLPAGVVTKVATAFSSPLEKKFRRKVGAYKTLDRLMWDGEHILIPSVDNNEDWACGFSVLCADCML